MTIYIDENLLLSDALIECCKAHATEYAIITDDNVQPLYAEKLQAHLHQHQIPNFVISVAHGEHSKTRETASAIQDQLCERGCGRDTGILALGGGMITDLAGFVAATYCRGIPAIYLPTSLLAMVDAAIGGKTGVNTQFAKNLVGVFAQPKALFADINTLITLPEIEYICAFAEIIKHALIFDADYFEFLLTHAERLKARDLSLLKSVINTSCAIKSKIVATDEKETGLRAICNFGHTIGHAIEHVSNYALNHGQAVAIGIILEAYIATELQILSKEDFKKIEDIIKLFAIPTTVNITLNQTELKKALTLDKKSRKKTPHMVMLAKIGQTYQNNDDFTLPITDLVLESALSKASNLRFF